MQKELDALRKAHAPCPHVIAGLESELTALKLAHTPCGDQIKELTAHVARLDKRLAEELEKEEALAKELGEEKRKEAEVAMNAETAAGRKSWKKSRFKLPRSEQTT